MKLKDACLWKESYDKPRQHIKKQRHHFANKGPYSQSNSFSSNYVQMWELDHKEGWTLKNWCFQMVVLEKTLESHLDSKEIKTINPKGISPEYWMNWCWSWSSNTLATWCKELTQWKIPWSWERLRAKGETGCWNDWTASPTQWTWIWANSGR